MVCMVNQEYGTCSHTHTHTTHLQTTARHQPVVDERVKVVVVHLCCYSIVTVLSQCCYSVVTVSLQCRYSVVTNSKRMSIIESKHNVVQRQDKQ
jgi:hypothetical protein